MRRLPGLLAAAGFAVESIEPHAYVQTTNPDYLLTLLSRGMSAAGHADEIGQAMVESFNAVRGEPDLFRFADISERHRAKASETQTGARVPARWHQAEVLNNF